MTLTAGNKVLTEVVFRETGPDVFLDGLKRVQGNSVAAETAAPVANAAEMTGLSVNRLGRHSDEIVGFLGQVLKEKYGVKTDTAFMDRRRCISRRRSRGSSALVIPETTGRTDLR